MKISPRSRFAPAVAIEDPEMLRDRLLDPEVKTITLLERMHIATMWRPVRPEGRPSRSFIARYERMCARLRDPRAVLTKTERADIATWRPVRPKRRPPQPAVIKRSRVTAVAYTFIRLREGGMNRKRALEATASRHNCSDDTVEKYLVLATDIPDEKIQRDHGLLPGKPRRK